MTHEWKPTPEQKAAIDAIKAKIKNGKEGKLTDKQKLDVLWDEFVKRCEG